MASGSSSIPAASPASAAVDVRRSMGMGPGRVLRRALLRDPLGAVGVFVVASMSILVFVAPMLLTLDPYGVDLERKLTPPNGQEWLGTDEVGRDLFARILYGGRLSMLSGLVVLLLTAIIGSGVGLIAGYYSGLLDEIVMRISDFFMAFPYLILAMAIAFALGASLQNAVIAVVIVFWPSYARLIRGQVAAIRSREFIEAIRALGASDVRIMARHVLPQTWSALIIKMTHDIGFTVVALASLGFIGLGARPPVAEWGTMIAESRIYALDAWWYGLFPGLAIFLTVLGFNLLGDLIQQLVEPELRRAG